MQDPNIYKVFWEWLQEKLEPVVVAKNKYSILFRIVIQVVITLILTSLILTIHGNINFDTGRLSTEEIGRIRVPLLLVVAFYVNFLGMRTIRFIMLVIKFLVKKRE